VHSNTIAMLLAADATRRRIEEPPPEPRATRPRKPRRAAAIALHAAARRLDPYAPVHAPRW
jgi:hypothetical protein